MRISILVVRALVHELARRNIGVDELCRGTGFDPVLLEDPSARIPIAGYERLIGRAMDITGDAQLGLHVGARTPIAALTVVGHLVTSCRTLREAAEMLSRYIPLVADEVRVSLREQSGTVELAIDLHPAYVHRAYCIELSLALVQCVVRIFIGNQPLEVCFEHEAQGPLETYLETFGSAVHFRADSNALRASAEVFDRRQLHTDALLRELLRNRADAMLANLEAPDKLPIRVREYIMAHEQPGAVSAAMLAEAFQLTERALRRRLLELGTGLREILDETLHDMARHALEERGVSIQEISFRLGYSEPSAFHRAFKRWTGMTPAEFRSGARVVVER
jgi:AraC-like DNA-binding protein